MTIAILKTQANSTSLSPNISLGVPFAFGSFHPNFCFAETILNNNIKRNFNKSLVGCSSEVKQ